MLINPQNNKMQNNYPMQLLQQNNYMPSLNHNSMIRQNQIPQNYQQMSSSSSQSNFIQSNIPFNNSDKVQNQPNNQQF